QFVQPGESLLIPFLGFTVGVGIDFTSFVEGGVLGVVLGVATIIFSGGTAMAVLWLVHVVRRRPKQARNLISGASEATTAGNAVATSTAVASVDPTFSGIVSSATAQVAAATITTALLVPFLVAYIARWHDRRGV